MDDESGESMEPMEEVPSIIVTYSAPVRGRAFSVAGRWLGTRYRLTFGTSHIFIHFSAIGKLIRSGGIVGYAEQGL